MVRKWSRLIYIKARFGVEALRNQKGAQAIEYVAVCAMVVVLLGAIIGAMNSGSKDIGKVVVEKLKGWFESFGGD